MEISPFIDPKHKAQNLEPIGASSNTIEDSGETCEELYGLRVIGVFPVFFLSCG
jgi:hypothetical protein